ncbi:formyltransferase family protein [Prochlorococcus sp. MIT 1307]|uniref:formyltransferase family protein n=1 Tax=Prochlorococcus sp. MIT 1307 TaxID=3096219 RepID=UPI002A74DBB7|nr:formyltransferase family protein [Prochlorococcus sp. MIT 1307]
MRIACIGYRKWSLNIYDALAGSLDHTFLIIRSKSQYSEEAILNFDPDIILFYGWSWIVSEKIIEKYKCLMLHPSPLPKYRGGTPIQNQIINGEQHSMVTIFLMNKKLDSGDIVDQKYLSLEGNIQDIFLRMEKIGLLMTLNILKSFPEPRKQRDSDATHYTRRTIEQGELTIEELEKKDSKYLYNKIRMLTYPYPNAYIRTIDNKFLLIKDVELVNDLQKNNS